MLTTMTIEAVLDYLCFYGVVLCQVSLHFADAMDQFAQMFATVLDVKMMNCVLCLLEHYTVVSLIVVRVHYLNVWTRCYVLHNEQLQLLPLCCVPG